MAPFGRKFLKARMKNRSNHKEARTEKEVHVWVCQEEKVVSGITKYTTCADVVEALLEDHKTTPENKRVLHGESKDYCLLERWKGFERALPPLTRILWLWNAWGREQPTVQFVLVNSSEFGTQSSEQAVNAKAAITKSRHGVRGQAQHIKSLPTERRRQVVKKAFRKLERIKRESSDQKAVSIDRMVQLIIAQDHTIQQQINRMRELDLEITCVEQQLQLEQQWAEVECDRGISQACGHLMEQYLHASCEVDQLDFQVKKQWELIEKLTCDIDKEIMKISWSDPQEPQAASAGTCLDLEEFCEATEVEKMRTDLEHSLRIGLSLNLQVAELDGKLSCCEATLKSSQQDCERLAAQLSSLHVGDGSDVTSVEERSCGLQLCECATELTDTDSDTGISSTLSQDSLTLRAEVPPPLDSDV